MGQVVFHQALFSRLRHVKQFLDVTYKFSIANYREVSLAPKVLFHFPILQTRLIYVNPHPSAHNCPATTAPRVQACHLASKADWQRAKWMWPKEKAVGLSTKCMATASIDWCYTIVRVVARCYATWPNADLPLSPRSGSIGLGNFKNV